MEALEPVASIASHQLPLPPSCIQFCPAYRDYFAIGTYELQESSEPTSEPEPEQPASSPQAPQPQQRNGSLLVFRLDGDQLLHLHTAIQPSALFDLHFSPHHGDVLATVSSTGALSLFRLSVDPEVSLTQLASCSPPDLESAMMLSCTWHPSIPGLLGITTSTCAVLFFHVDVDPDQAVWQIREVSQDALQLGVRHTLEVWTLAFAAVDPGVEPQEVEVFSGGDDAQLICTNYIYDGSVGIDSTRPPRRIMGHDAGVTAILPLDVRLEDGSTVLLSGSYDDRMRVYAGGRLLAALDLGGGVWRLKLISLVQDGGSGEGGKGRWTAMVLASCMHAGARVVRVSGDGKAKVEIKLVARFEEHKSMNYGSDFWRGSDAPSRGGKALRCVSTSFYDRLLCLWDLDLECNDI